MTRLRVRLRGKQVYDIELSSERVYVAGRREDCDIVLQPEKGISREHFKIALSEGVWNVDVISRYGDVLFEGEQVQQFALQHGSQFSVPPYEFEFLNVLDDVSLQEKAHDNSASNLPALTSANEADVFQGSEERTLIGVAPTTAYIKILDAQNEVQEMIRLEGGDSWAAGRDTGCDIQIRDQRVSRRQFEIRRTGAQYVIVDLGSVNGTLLNGTPVSATEPAPLKSGDAISVLTNYLYFELHDSNYQNRLEMVRAEPPRVLMPMSPTDSLPMAYQPPLAQEMVSYQTPLGVAEPAPSTRRFDFQKNRPKVIGGAVLLLVLVYIFAGGDKTEGPGNPSAVVVPGSPQEAFAKLQPEQQALVRQRYKDAKNLYMQGKYQLAQDEIVKIQGVVPDYEDIKEIERLSKEAIFIQEQQRRQEQVEQAKLEMEEKIQKQTEICQSQINPSITMAQMDDCLSSVMEFNPEHPRILNLKSQVDSILAQQETKAAERAAYQSQVARLRGIYEKAQKVHRTGRPMDAITAYQKVLGADLPDPNGLKSQSQRNIASLRQLMNSKTASLQAEAEKYYQAQNLKGAILSLRKARVLDPDNQELTEKIELYTVELRKNMMTIYQEGILEESFGNVEGGESKAGAKDKWRKILELDIPDGEYYKKAYIKLKKYGAI